MAGHWSPEDPAIRLLSKPYRYHRKATNSGEEVWTTPAEVRFSLVFGSRAARGAGLGAFRGGSGTSEALLPGPPVAIGVQHRGGEAPPDPKACTPLRPSRDVAKRARITRRDSPEHTWSCLRSSFTHLLSPRACFSGAALGIGKCETAVRSMSDRQHCVSRVACPGALKQATLHRCIMKRLPSYRRMIRVW